MLVLTHLVGFGGGATPSSAPPGTPIIDNLSTSTWKEDATGIEINGSEFGDVIGSGSIKLTSQGRDQADRITINQTVTGWTATKITITAVMPQHNAANWPGYFNLTVINNELNESDTTLILIGPNQTVAGTEHASGMAVLTNSSTQTEIDAEAAGTAFFCDVTLTEKSLTLKAADAFIAGPSAEMRGSKDISSSNITWNVDGSSWRIDSQTQSDNGNQPSRISDSWHLDNDKRGKVFVGSRFCQLRREGSKAGIESAVSTGQLTNPFTTTAGSRWVRVAHTAHSEEFGEVERFENASAVGGLTIDGFYTNIRAGTNYYEIEHDSAATSSATGGGTVDYTYGIQAYFDSSGNKIYINIDPTSDFDIWAATTTTAFAGSNDDIIIRGPRASAFTDVNDQDGFFSIYGYGNDAQRAAISDFSGNAANNWTLQFLNTHHCSGAGIGLSGSDCEVWDTKMLYCSQQGMKTQAAGSGVGGLILRRFEMAYHNTSHYSPTWEAGGCKITRRQGLDVDQGMVHHINGFGFWPDIDNDDILIKRLDIFETRLASIHFENVDTTLGVLITNNLIRDFGYNPDFFNKALPTGIRIASAGGTAAENLFVTFNQIEVPDNIDPGSGPANALTVRADNRTPVNDYVKFLSNVIIYEGTTSGTPQSGFMSGSPEDSQTDIDTMQNTGDFALNIYYHTGPSSDLVFHYVNSGPTNADINKSTWVETHGYDDDSTFFWSRSGAQITAAKSDWVKGDMPTWSDVQAT